MSAGSQLGSSLRVRSAPNPQAVSPAPSGGLERCLRKLFIFLNLLSSGYDQAWVMPLMILLTPSTAWGRACWRKKQPCTAQFEAGQCMGCGVGLLVE